MKYTAALHGGFKIFYPSDFSWRCQRCARCCGDTREHERLIRVTDHEAKLIAEATGIPTEEFTVPNSKAEPYPYRLSKTNSGRCVFLRTDTCAIYSVRPLTCRFFPFFLGKYPNKILRFEVTNERCPGIGGGDKLTSKFYFALVGDALKELDRE